MNDDRTRIAGRGSPVGIGVELNQTYRIDSLLGTGGMGEVFKGHNIQTGDPVAIKIVLPEFAQDETILNLFRKEARILNHLNHEAIVRYYVFSIDPILSRPYLAMEFVDGPSLAAHVKTAPLTAPEFMPLLRRLADGLHRAHGAGVIHRDMSPDNVILPGGLVQNAKIIDFGIARSANVGGETLLGGSFAGKYNFVSPEQLGLYGGEVTPKSDIYSLALVMVAAMRGRPLDMSGSQLDIIEKRRSVPDLTGIPKQFHAVLSAMLTPDPAKRPADMAAIRDWPETPSPSRQQSDKRKAGAVNAVHAKPPAPSHALRNSISAIAIVAVIGLGAFGGWIYTQQDAGSGGSQGSTAQPALRTQNDTPESPPPKQPENETATTDTGGASSPDTRPSEPNPPKSPEIGQQIAKGETTPPSTSSDKPPLSRPPEQPKPSTGRGESVKSLPVEGSGPDRPAQAEGSKEPVTENPTKQQEPSATPPENGKPPQTTTRLPPDETTLTGPSARSDNQQALLPPVIPTPIVPPPSTPSLRDFVRNFGTDDCFAATKDEVSATSATVTALGTPEAGQKFSAAFRQRAGFTAALTLDSVSAQQCGFVGALPRMSLPDAPPLNISVSKTDIRGGDGDAGTAGDPLTVSVTGAGDRNIYLFVMDHMGGIQNINRLCAACITMKTGAIDAALSLFSPAKIEGEAREPFYPMLVFAIASPRPLISVNAQDAFEADDFIAPFLKEIATGSGVATAAAFVKLHD